MIERRWWRLAALALVAIVAGLFAAFNTGERVALNLGFTMLYRVPLVPLIFLVFMAGMTTMFLVGLRHDARVRRALRDAGLGEPMSEGSRLGESERPEIEAPIAGSPPHGDAVPPQGGDGIPEAHSLSASGADDPWEPARVRDVEAARDDSSASWAETGAVEQPPEPLPPDQEPRDPP